MIILIYIAGFANTCVSVQVPSNYTEIVESEWSPQARVRKTRLSASEKLSVRVACSTYSIPGAVGIKA